MGGPGVDLTPAQATMLIARLARVVRREYEQALTPLGLRQREVVALSYLRGHGATAQQVLAERLCMDPSSTVCLLNALERERLVARARDQTDRRRALIELTAAGEEALAAVDRAVQGVEESMMAGLECDERSELHRLLAKLGPGEVDWAAAARE